MARNVLVLAGEVELATHETEDFAMERRRAGHLAGAQHPPGQKDDAPAALRLRVLDPFSTREEHPWDATPRQRLLLHRS